MFARLLHELRLAAIALQFLTRLPVPARVGFEPAWLHASARHFPLVGLVVGGIGVLAWWIAAQRWPPAVAAGLALSATVVLTGGFHEDGLADTFDGLGGAVSRERALQIMKDSRLGSYGALALVLVLGLKWQALASLGAAGVSRRAAAAWLMAHATSRAAAVGLLWRMPYAGDADHAKAKPMAQQVSADGAFIAFAWPVIAALAIVAVCGREVGVPLACAVAAAIVVALAMARWLRRRLGGYTGDTLGAAQQLTELAALLAWSAAA
jgi:adenosylcobinamide-GDP ribazoletransferase